MKEGWARAQARLASFPLFDACQQGGADRRRVRPCARCEGSSCPKHTIAAVGIARTQDKKDVIRIISPCLRVSVLLYILTWTRLRFVFDTITNRIKALGTEELPSTRPEHGTELKACLLGLTRVAI